MTPRGAQIIGLGAYVPDRVLTNADLEKMVDTSDEWIVSHTGMRERHIAAPEQATSDLALAAARRALDDSGVTADDIDLVIVATVTADYSFPTVSSQLQDLLGLPRAGAFDLGIGCTGFIYALSTGTAFIRSGACNHVLVVAAETLSRIVDWTDRSTCVLFGDGAGAVVLGPAEPGEGVLACECVSDGANGRYLSLPAGGSRQPIDEEAIRNHDNTLHMEGPEVFRLAVRGCPDIAEAVVNRAGLQHSDIDWAVMHQANKRIIDAAAKRLEIPVERVFCNIEKYANTSAATIPLALSDMREEGLLKQGDTVLMAAFGAGFSLAASIVRWTK